MEVARAITYILFPVFIGLTIGGVVGENNGLFAFGVISLLLDIVIGIALQNSIDRKANNDNWNNLTYEQKREKAHNAVEKAKQDLRDQGVDVDAEIEKFCDDFNREHKLGKYAEENPEDDSLKEKTFFKNEGDTESFTLQEIVDSIVSWDKAEYVLTNEEYAYASVLYEGYKQDDYSLKLSKSEFITLCSEIMSKFDILVPYYYKLSDDPSVREFMMEYEDEKQIYRRRAINILKQEEISSEEWRKLYKEFWEKFYA